MNSEQRDGWQKEVTPQIKQNLMQSAKACITNGNSLLSDAELLLENERYARAASLAVLAVEEYGKALHLAACVTIERWDTVLYKGISQHNSKQVYAEVLLSLPEDLIEDLFEKFGYGSIAVTLTKISDHKKRLTDHVVAIAKKTQKKPLMDKLKQKGFYVDISVNATVKSEPDSILEEETIGLMGRAKTIRHLATSHIEAYQTSAFSSFYKDLLDTYRRYLRNRFPVED